MPTGKETVPLQMRIPPDLHQWIKIESAKLERSQNWLLNNLLREAKQRAEQEQRQ